MFKLFTYFLQAKCEVRNSGQYNCYNIYKNLKTCHSATKCDGMQIVNLKIASFAGQVSTAL